MFDSVLSPRGRYSFAVSGAIILTLAACGLKEESQWVTASKADLLFTTTETKETLKSTDLERRVIACEEVLPEARAALEKSGASGHRALLQACAKRGLALSDNLRCVQDELQVLCR